MKLALIFLFLASTNLSAQGFSCDISKYNEYKEQIKKPKYKTEEVYKMFKDKALLMVLDKQLELQEVFPQSGHLEHTNIANAKVRLGAKKASINFCTKHLKQSAKKYQKLEDLMTSPPIVDTKKQENFVVNHIVASSHISQTLPLYNKHLNVLEKKYNRMNALAGRCQFRGPQRRVKCAERLTRHETAKADILEYQQEADKEFSHFHYLIKEYPLLIDHGEELIGIPIRFNLRASPLLSKFGEMTVKNPRLRGQRKRAKYTPTLQASINQMQNSEKSEFGFIQNKLLAIDLLKENPGLKNDMVANIDTAVRRQFNKNKKMMKSLCKSGEKNQQLHNFANLVEAAIMDEVHSIDDLEEQKLAKMELQNHHCEMKFAQMKKQADSLEGPIGELALYGVGASLVLNLTPVGPMIMGSRATAMLTGASISFVSALVWKRIKLQMFQGYGQHYNLEKAMNYIKLSDENTLREASCLYRQSARYFFLDILLLPIDVLGLKITRYVHTMHKNVLMGREFLFEAEKNMIRYGQQSKSLKEISNYNILRDELQAAKELLKNGKDLDELGGAVTTIYDIGVKLKTLVK